MSPHVRFHHTPTLAPRRLMLALILAAAWAPAAFAQSAETQEQGGQWALGVGAIAVDKVYRDFDQEFYALPVVSYENKWISASVPTFDVKLFRGESLSLRLRARWSGDGYEAKDSPVLVGMEERKGSLWAGAALVWKTDVVNVSADVLTDAMNESGGLRAKVQLDRRFSTGRFGFTPRLAAEWADDKYVDYYYGVRLDEVTADRPFYEGKATTSLQVGLRTDYTPSRHHTIFLDVGATRMGSTIEDSPLVDKSNQTTVALGYVYRF